MTICRRWVFRGILAILCASCLFARSVFAEAPIPLPPQTLVQIAAEQQPLATGDFIRAAMALSGVPASELDASAKDVQSFLDQVKVNLPDPNSNGFAGVLLSYLHATKLTHYDSSEARINVLMQKGHFNCVSSSILYAIAARSFGLNAQIARTNDHAFCRVKSGETWLDVETTNALGGSPPGKWKRVKSLTDVEALSLVLQTRLNHSCCDGELIRLAIDWASITHDASIQNQIGYFSTKYIRELNNKRSYADVHNLIEYFKTRFAGESPQTLSMLVNNQVAFLTDQGRFQEARDLLMEHSDALDVKTVHSLAGYLTSRMVQIEVKRHNLDNAIDLVADLSTRGFLEERLVQDYLQYLYAQKADVIAGKEGISAAYNFLIQTPEPVQQLPVISKRLALYLRLGAQGQSTTD